MVNNDEKVFKRRVLKLLSRKRSYGLLQQEMQQLAKGSAEMTEVYRRFSGIKIQPDLEEPKNDNVKVVAPTVIAKDYETNARLMEAMCKNIFLRNFDKSFIQAFIDAMYLQTIPAGTRIIRQGDCGGPQLYISESGTFDVYHGNKYESSFGAGVVFGELAILYNTKRSRSIDVRQGAEVWVLDRSAFEAAILKENVTKPNETIDQLLQIPVLVTLPRHILTKVSQLVETEFFEEDSSIIRQGAPATKFFIIIGGSVALSRRETADEGPIVVGKEHYFGEQAFSGDEDEVYDVTATALKPGVVCLTLETKALLDCLGSLDLIQKDKWMSELRTRSNSYSIEWTNKYPDLNVTDFKYIETLGVGAFARVELVTIPNVLGESFALKTVKKSRAVELECEKYFLGEKKIMQFCNSPFVCRLYQTYKDDTYIYFLMEACLGGDLSTYLARHGPFDNTPAKFVMANIVEAIAYLHNHGIVYRDLKPDNVVIDSHGYLKLTDFGCSKMIGLDKTWSFVGTPEYMAPEILFNKPYDRAVDYWSMGVLMYEILVGHPPFQDNEKIILYSKILKGFDSSRVYGGVLRKPAENLIRSLLRTDPSRRLGNLRAGTADIRKHKWFKDFDWDSIQDMSLPSPVIPTIQNHLDTRNFEKYPCNDEDFAEPEFSGWDKDF
ncbi:hypothetical protein TKK_0012394 [Trichogramma kaykai]|uniref:cGMP-dependent protein kinase n=1 Tax=Trichogramma kaykai TaxID=54128 RepID=A0ABD2WNQ4_9HYME